MLVSFTNTGDSSVLCDWIFGDGNSSTDCLTTSNTYLNAGIYAVSLTITDTNDYVKLFDNSGTNLGSALIFDNLDITTYKYFKITKI